MLFKSLEPHETCAQSRSVVGNSTSIVRGSGSVKPSLPRSRESAQCILDVINLERERVNEGEVEASEREDKMLGVLCRS